MEPDDIPLHDLLGTGDDAVAGPGPLRAIVARAGRRRRRIAAAGMAVALVVGGAVGYGLSDHSSPAAETSTASAGSTTSSTGASSASAASSGGATGAAVVAPNLPVTSPEKLTRLFTRTTGGITLRVFHTNFNPPAALPAGCQLGLPEFQVEVSTAEMVGITVSGAAPTTRTQPLTAVETRVVGAGEGNPVAVVTAATGPTVTRVEVSLTGGATDTMSPRTRVGRSRRDHPRRSRQRGVVRDDHGP